MVSAPKKTPNAAVSLSIGEILPSLNLDTITATIMAAMKAAVPTIAPCFGSISELPNFDATKNNNNGPKSRTKFNVPDGFVVCVVWLTTNRR
jgi:hypothetical protein